jgi:fatty acid desaturase
MTSSFTALSQRVRDAGLLRRRRGFYIGLFGVLTTALLAAAGGFVLLGHSWFQLIIAGVLGIIFTQFAFLAHEASHRQVFATGPANDRAGRVLGTMFVGISYSWWMNKHSRHHANPNMVGKDPDIEIDTISFIEESAATRTGIMAMLTRKQGYLFFPLLMFEGVNLHYTSVRSLFGAGKPKKRVMEIITIALRLTLYVAAVFWFLPLGMAFAFLGVQLAVFGIYMGASFAPNHKGMPIIPRGSRLDFFSKQVMTSRNVSGGYPMSLAMGGLNYQIEHHLFPSMPRPHLAHARRMVIQHCADHDIPYTETNLLTSYGIVIRYLNRVGLSARDPFECPLTAQYRPH